MSEMRIGQFQILGTLGSGAHSTILHVRRSADGRNYALKVVPIQGNEDQKFLEQAQHEFRVAGMLDHKNLIKVYALEMVKDWLFRIRKVHLLIEYVNGKTLDKMPALSVPRLVQIFSRVAAGLNHMHRRGVCHADLNAHNILLSEDGVYLVDFDRCQLRGGGLWRDANLVRLRRSLEKLTWALPPERFAEADWHGLLDGYRQSSGSPGPELLAAAG